LKYHFYQRRFVKIFNTIVQVVLFGVLSSCSSENIKPSHEGFPDDRRYVAGRRGGRIINLRHPKRVNVPDTQSIFVYKDGHADNDNLHGLNKTVQLPLSLKASLEQLIYSWCTKSPTFDSIRDDGLYYSFAFDCGPVGEQILIPVNQLPSELQQLLELFNKP
jgi:hypothetical protein